MIGRLESVASAIVAVVLAAAAPALAAKPPAAPSDDPSALKTMFDCRKLPTKEARADCYDAAVDALQNAQAKGEVVVVDREKIKAVRRQAFGFSLPSISLLTKGLKEEPVKSIEIELKSAHQSADGYWVMTTVEDSVWRQTQNSGYEFTPHAGSKLIVRPGILGAYFCEVDGQPQVRCRREQ